MLSNEYFDNLTKKLDEVSKDCKTQEEKVKAELDYLDSLIEQRETELDVLEEKVKEKEKKLRTLEELGITEKDYIIVKGNH